MKLLYEKAARKMLVKLTREGGGVGGATVAKQQQQQVLPNYAQSWLAHFDYVTN